MSMTPEERADDLNDWLWENWNAMSPTCSLQKILEALKAQERDGREDERVRENERVAAGFRNLISDMERDFGISPKAETQADNGDGGSDEGIT